MANESLGEAIGLSDRNTSYVPQILTTMRNADAQIVADMKAKKAQAAQHKKDMEKYDSELQNFTLTADSGLWEGYHKDIQTHAAKIKDYVDQKRSSSPDWNPRSDSELNKMVFNLKSDADVYKQATARMNTDISKLQQLHPEDYELNKELSDIIASGDKDKLLAFQQKQAQGSGLDHLVNPKGLYYGGLYQLNDKPTTFLPILETDAGKLGQQLVKESTLPDGTKVRISTATPEQIKAGFQSFALTNKSYQKFRKNSVISGETNPVTGQPFKDANEVDNYFADRYAASVKQSYANIQQNPEQKQAQQLAPFTPFKSAGTITNGTRIADIHGKPIKTTLIVNIADESGKESPTTLADAPVEHITNIGTKEKPNLVASVTVPEYVDEKKTVKEIDDEKSKLRAEGKPTSTISDTRRVKKNVTKRVDINPDTKEGTNNYQALISIPGFKEKYIDPVLALDVKSNKSERAIPEVNSQSEYDAIPKGGKYISNGKTLIKK